MKVVVACERAGYKCSANFKVIFLNRQICERTRPYNPLLPQL
jgi:hypothetical protein